MKKSKTRLYIHKEISLNLLVYIKDKQFHFLRNVMRVKINDIISLFDGITGEWDSKIMSINRKNIVLRVIKKIKSIIEEPDIWLIFAPIKQYRMNIVIQKATELGVSKIIPCFTDFTNLKSININNFKQNAIEAAEQSERMFVPTVDNPVKLKIFLNSMPDDRCLIYCDEKMHKNENLIASLNSIKNKYKKWSLLVGPEGGFSDSEKELITKTKNILRVSLGKRLLRSDTAITVSLFCIQELIN